MEHTSRICHAGHKRKVLPAVLWEDLLEIVFEPCTLGQVTQKRTKQQMDGQIIAKFLVPTKCYPDLDVVVYSGVVECIWAIVRPVNHGV